MKRILTALALTMPMAIGGTAAFAQSYPDHEITLRVPLGAGGSTDTAARVVAEYLGQALGQTVVVENRPGAGGVVGTTQTMQDAPDGYTLQYTPSSLFTSAPIQHPDLPYSVDDFDFLVSFGFSAPVLVINESEGLSDLSDFVDQAAADGRRITYGHAGVGSSLQLAGQRLFQQAGLEAQQIPFESGAAALTALIAGDIVAYVGPETTILPYVGEGVVPLAVASSERSPFLPDVPTMREEGYDVSLASVSMLHAPAGLPDDVRARLTEALNELEGNEEFRDRLADLGIAVSFTYDSEVTDYISETRAVFEELMGSGN